MTTDWVGLRRQVADLLVLRCRLTHERVLLHEGQARWVDRAGASLDPVRVGFCRPEVRKQNLSCAHTLARYQLHDALVTLHAGGRLDAATFAALDQQLSEAALAVQVLDHAKGDTDRAYAQAVERMTAGEAPAAAEVSLLAVELRAIEAGHEASVTVLEAVRAAALRALDGVEE